MVARVLCQAHNGALSPFDKEVGRLFDVVAASYRRQLDTWETINGSHIERWALKLMFADAAAGKIGAFDGTPVPKEHPPEDWLRVVFCGAPLPARCGLYFSEQPLSPEPATVGIFYNYSPSTDRFPNMLVGVTVQMLGFTFVTSLFPLDERGWNVIYRPQQFSSWDSTTAGFRFAWDDDIARGAA